MKQRYSILIPFLILGSMFFFGCRSTQPQEKPNHLFAEFFVRYLQAEKELKAHVSFYEGDTVKTAVPKSFAGGATFQGHSMEARNLPGGTIRYIYEQLGTYADTFQFRFKDDFGQNRIIPVAMTPIDSFAVQGGQASRSAGMSLFARGGQLNQGESMVLLFSDEDQKASTIMLTGPEFAAEKALKRAGMTKKDIDLWELNEAFASVVLRFMQALDIDHSDINVNGGAIAMGHPLGATGSMIFGTMVDELERSGKSTALVTLCIGAGMGTATIIERV